MENGNKEKKGGVVLFSEEELKDMSGLKIHEDHIEVLCGCTCVKYGDAVGNLRVYQTGELFIKCDCFPGCGEDKLTPAGFEKHTVTEGARKWKKSVWVMIDGDKVPLSRTALLKYYEKSLDGKWSHKSLNVHQDEFVQCTRCSKLRRFRMRTKGDCRNHHDATLKGNWICADHPHDRLTCDDEEERATRRALRGCPRHRGACNGCTMCVCLGCSMCRYEDCSCQTCIDFSNNAKN